MALNLIDSDDISIFQNNNDIGLSIEKEYIVNSLDGDETDKAPSVHAVKGMQLVVNTLTGNETDNAPSVHAVNERFTYSTTEQVIGTWIDGKPIYRKTINFGTLPNATTKTVAHNILNVDEILKYYGKALSTSGNSFVLPYPAVVSSETMSMYVNSTDIVIVTGINRSSLTTYVTLEYTKTTDIATISL